MRTQRDNERMSKRPPRQISALLLGILVLELSTARAETDDVVRSALILEPNDPGMRTDLPAGRVARAASIYLGDIGFSSILASGAPTGDVAQQVHSAEAIAKKTGSTAIVWYRPGRDGQILVSVFLSVDNDGRLTTFATRTGARAEREIALKLRALLSELTPAQVPIPAEVYPTSDTSTPTPTSASSRTFHLALSQIFQAQLFSANLHRGTEMEVAYGATTRLRFSLAFALLGPAVHFLDGGAGSLRLYRPRLGIEVLTLQRRLQVRMGAWAALEINHVQTAEGTSRRSATRLAPMIGLAVRLEMPLRPYLSLSTMVSSGTYFLRQQFLLGGRELFDTGRFSLGISGGLSVRFR